MKHNHIWLIYMIFYLSIIDVYGQDSICFKEKNIDHLLATSLQLSNNKNYVSIKYPTVKTTDINILSPSQQIHTINYFDGLGRTLQSVQIGISPAGKDVVTYQEYDGLGRPSNVWLPVPVSSNSGSFADLSIITSNIQSIYPNESAPYSKSVYENSPLNRVLEEYGPGNKWHSGNKAIRTDYKTNKKVGNIDLECAYFIISGSTLKKNTNYADGELYVTERTDEDENKIFTFTDKMERIILLRQLNGAERIDTYYIYDELGNIVLVLPPLFIDSKKLVSNIIIDLDSDDDIHKYAYRYIYDERNKCVMRKLPGCDWIYSIYDKAGQLIFSQDGEQRKENANKWTFYKYNAFGEIILSGIQTINKSHQELINYCKNIVVKEEAIQGGYGYSNIYLSELIDYKNVLLANYYDGYDYLLSLYPDKYDQLKYEDKEGFDKKYNSMKGLLTGTRSKLLDNSGGELISIFYYDYMGQIIQTKSTNHLERIEKEYIAYNFGGNPIKRLSEEVFPNGGIFFSECYQYFYDHAQRLVETKHKVGNRPEIVLSVNEYDELGRLKSTMFNNNLNLKLNYSYNIRSWLNSISGVYFKEELQYSYTGNIISQQWFQNGNDREYLYNYDGLSRLESAYFNSNSMSDRYSNFETSYSYDKQGNIKFISRSGYNDGPYGIIDDLQFTHYGNQLLTATENSINTPLSSTSYDFKDYSYGIANPKYAYNLNGSMIRDPYKGIDIRYNSLNLPEYINVPAVKGDVRFLYAADGTKLRMSYKYNSFMSLDPQQNIGGGFKDLLVNGQNDYSRNKLYTGNGSRVLNVFTDNGYYHGMVGKYYFYLKDHQGNNRVVIDDSGNIVQQTEYYPFGMPFGNEPGVEAQRYKYNGKEFCTINGLNLYDYHKRMMDPQLGRFREMDPLCEKYYSISPYTYCMNNPMRYVDPTGMLASPIYNTLGELLGTDDQGLQGVPIVLDGKDFVQGMSHEQAKELDVGIDGLKDVTAKIELLASFVNLPSRPDYDGKLTLSEANSWYRTGNGKPLFVDGSKINLEPLYIENLVLNEMVVFNFASPRYANIETGLVYGNIGLTLLNEQGEVRIGDKNGKFDVYDFDQHVGGRSFRNVATLIGKKIAGNGIGFDILGYKNAHLKHRPKYIQNK